MDNIATTTSDSTPTPTPAAGGNGGDASPRTVDNLLDGVVQGAHETIDRLAETAAPHVRQLQEGMSSAKATLQARGDEVRDLGAEWAQDLRDTVRAHPLAAVAGALAVGMLIARLAR